MQGTSMGCSVQLPGCALCVTSVVHPGLWLNPTSSHFSRQTALSSVQQVSVTAPGLRLGAEGLSLWWERDSGAWRDQTGCWRDQRVQIRETMESGCQLRPTCVCVCLHVKESSTAAAAGWQPQRLLCPRASSWGNWEPRATPETAECLSPVAEGIHLAGSHFPAGDILPELTDRGKNEAIGVFCVFWSAIFSVALCGQHIHMAYICVVYTRVVFAHLPSGDTSAPSLMAGSGAVEMWQLCLCQAEGFRNLLSRVASPSCKCQ